MRAVSFVNSGVMETVGPWDFTRALAMRSERSAAFSEESPRRRCSDVSFLQRVVEWRYAVRERVVLWREAERGERVEGWEEGGGIRGRR